MQKGDLTSIDVCRRFEKKKKKKTTTNWKKKLYTALRVSTCSYCLLRHSGNWLLFGKLPQTALRGLPLVTSCDQSTRDLRRALSHSIYDWYVVLFAMIGFAVIVFRFVRGIIRYDWFIFRYIRYDWFRCIRLWFVLFVMIAYYSLWLVSL